MKLTKKQIKERYYQRVYDEAPIIECACGCGQKIKAKDHYGRDRKYINGHNNRKYKDPIQYKREWNHRNRTKRQKYKMDRVHRIKRDLILSKGGKCGICGLPFNGECTSLFDFHHRNPSEKKFNLNNYSIISFKLILLWEEAEKCDLLCANCHRLLHWDWKKIEDL